MERGAEISVGCDEGSGPSQCVNLADCKSAIQQTKCLRYAAETSARITLAQPRQIIIVTIGDGTRKPQSASNPLEIRLYCRSLVVLNCIVTAEEGSRERAGVRGNRRCELHSCG